MVLNADTVNRFDLKRVRLELDTERDRSRQERMEFAQMILQAVGPASASWALELMDAPNKEMLLQAMEQGDMGQQLMGQFEEAAKQIGMDPQELIQTVMQQLQMQVQASQQPQQPPQGRPPEGVPPQAPPDQGIPPQGPPPQGPPPEQAI